MSKPISNFWNDKGIFTGNAMQLAGKYTENILEAPSPYHGILSGTDLPDEQCLINSSSILAVRPDLKEKSYAAQIAFDEYVHYVNQTYFFEVLGFQVVSDLCIRSESLDHFHSFLAQAMDEVRHVQAYYELRRGLPHSAPFVPCIPVLFQKIIERGSYHEKVLKGLVVLEGLAIGLFAARSSLYKTSPTHKMDVQALKEETLHHQQATDIVGGILKLGRVKYDEVIDIVREGTHELTFDVLPTAIADKHGVGLSEVEAKKMKEVGLAGLQTSITRSCLRKSLKSFRSAA